MSITVVADSLMCRCCNYIEPIINEASMKTRVNWILIKWNVVCSVMASVSLRHPNDGSNAKPCLTWCLEQEHPCTPSSPLLHMAGQALLFSNSNWFVRALIISSSWINCIVDQHLIEKWPENVALFLVDFPRNKKPVYMLVKFQNKIGTKRMGTFFIKTSYLFF